MFTNGIRIQNDKYNDDDSNNDSDNDEITDKFIDYDNIIDNNFFLIIIRFGIMSKKA